MALSAERKKYRYPRGFFKEINATLKKMPQIAIEIEKTSKKFGLLPFFCNFCQIFDTLASLEVINIQQRKILLSKWRRRSYKCNLICKNASNSDRKWQKSQKLQIFKNFMQFLSIFRMTWWLRMSKTFKKEKIRCPRGFSEDIKAISARKNASNSDRN